MKVEIWSDIMCPFCYVGKKNFENALANLPFKEQIEVEWKSFQLDPDLPVEGLSISTKSYIADRKGVSVEEIQGMLDHLEEVGKAVDIVFNQDKSIPVNTLKGHRLIHFAHSKGKGNEMKEALLKAHFTDGKNVGDNEVLCEIASQVGFDTKEINNFLNSDVYSKEVNADIEEARVLGVSGVPFFVLDRKYGISGAQPTTTFIEALTTAFEESQPRFEMKEGSSNASCGPDGCDI